MAARLLFLLVLYASVALTQPLPRFIPYRDGDKWGYADSTGKILIEPKWRMAEFFVNGKARVYTEHEGSEVVCVIDSMGKYLVPPELHWTGAEEEVFLNTEKNGRWGKIDSNGRQVIPNLYDKEQQRTEHSWLRNRRRGFYILRKDGRIGVTDTSGMPVIPFMYEKIELVSGTTPDGKVFFEAVKDGRRLIIDTADKVWLTHNYRDIAFARKAKGLVVTDDNRDYAGLLDYPSFTVLIPPDKYRFISFYDEEHAIVTMKIGQQFLEGVIDRTGRELVPAKYRRIRLLDNGKLIVYREGEENGWYVLYEGYINPKTFRISRWKKINPDALSIPGNTGNDVIEIKIGATWTHAYERDSTEWRVTRHMGYTRIDNDTLQECYFVYGYDGKYYGYTGVVDIHGNEIVKPQNRYKDLVIVGDGLFLTNKRHIVDRHLNVLSDSLNFRIAKAFYYKGKLFMVGPEPPPPALTSDQIDMQEPPLLYLEPRRQRTLEEYLSDIVVLRDYRLFLRDNTIAPGFHDARVIGFVDSTGRRQQDFAGFLMVAGKDKTWGIVSPERDTVFEEISFRYVDIDGIGHRLFKATQYSCGVIVDERGKVIFEDRGLSCITPFLQKDAFGNYLHGGHEIAGLYLVSAANGLVYIDAYGRVYGQNLE